MAQSSVMLSQWSRCLRLLLEAPAPAGILALPIGRSYTATEIAVRAARVCRVFFVCSAAIVGTCFFAADAAAYGSFGSLPELVSLVKEIEAAVVSVSGPAGSVGSGFAVTSDGYIATSAHVARVEGPLSVRSAGGSTFKAEAVSFHATADVALLYAPEFRPRHVLALADSSKVEVGTWVLALGNPFGLGTTLSVGVIGAKGRSFGRNENDGGLFQTDAAINPGNSGGPLCNLQGEAVGVASAAISGGQGLGFAVPAELVRELIDKARRSAVSHRILDLPSESSFEGK